MEKYKFLEGLNLFSNFFLKYIEIFLFQKNSA